MDEITEEQLKESGAENEGNASLCIKCGECLEKCPQQLPIPALLDDVKEDMEGFMTKPLIWLGKRIMKVRKK